MELHVQFVSEIGGDAKRIDTAFHVVVPGFPGQTVVAPGGILSPDAPAVPHPSDAGQVVADVSVGAVPVDASEIGVPVGFQVGPDGHLFGPASRHSVSPVAVEPGIVVGEKPAMGRVGTVVLQIPDLFVGQRDKLDVSEPDLAADVAEGLFVGHRPLARLPERQRLAGQVGGLPENVLDSGDPCF